MGPLQAGHGTEDLAGQVLGRSRRAGGVVHLAVLRLHPGDQLGEVLRWHAGMHAYHDRRGGHQRDRRNVGKGVVGQLGHQAGQDGQRIGHQRERMAVGLRLEHGFQADHAAGAGAVLHHAGLAHGLGELLAQVARHEVRGTAGGERRDDAHRLARVGLRTGRRGGDAQCRRGQAPGDGGCDPAVHCPAPCICQTDAGSYTDTRHER